ncbi:hypothetical protein Ssi03_37230 [Sphaerisporangium siamense]|uniref:Actin-like ATPase involved in cell morphogenesis n=1 Tax=Sphaerisporangium siamense TaxID=795645 RepID=A0A7W7D7A3_9ACTN|nr:rod shape-determining protein [Sphaerisporangium siamense]MBB4701608.1 actin-like ATPase involved in cell morphogenesis [Sphaerisporangium siamense]GII85733.1 hypothetical protein Ssi03_37230 [Sphaerisporangium siamense]
MALDLGTARTRSLSSGGFAIADRSSVVRRAGIGVEGQVRPIRHGVVTDPEACLRLLRLVMQDAMVSGVRPVERVLAGVPVAASPNDRRTLHAAVAQAAGCAVTLVDGPLAAAVGAGLDVAGPRPSLLLDVGAGIVEAAAIRDRVIIDAAALQLSATTSAGLPAYALDGVVAMTTGLLRRLPDHLRQAVRAGGLVVTGGGAQQAELLHRLRTALRMPVSPAPDPQHATIRGLTRLCLQPALAAQLTSHGH